MSTGGIRPYTYQRHRRGVEGFHVDSATIQRATLGDEPSAGYGGAPTWTTVGTIPCRFPVPIAGSVLGQVPGAAIDTVQRRYGMTVAQDANVLEGDRVSQVIDLTGRQLNVRPMRVDAVVLRSTHALLVLEEYGVT